MTAVIVCSVAVVLIALTVVLWRVDLRKQARGRLEFVFVVRAEEAADPLEEAFAMPDFVPEHERRA